MRVFARRVLFVPLCLLVAPLSCGSNSAPVQGAPPASATAAAAPVSPGDGALVPSPASLAPLVESIKGVVVNVEVVARGRTPQLRQTPFGGNSPWDEFFGAPFGGPQQRQAPVKRGIGSGFIVDASGLVLTNNHVVEDATGIRVKLEDGRSFDAKILGRDPLTDVALIKLEGEVKALPVARLGDSDALRVGDWVVAIGNPFGLASSVSAGIVSAKARNIGAGPYDEFLQTDAAINPGNSGGPLFNLRGEVVGINTAIAGQGTGIGFAVPSNLAKALWPRLEKDGSVTRGYIGVAIQDLTPALARALEVPVKEGAVVGDVTPGTPAAKAGLEAEDVVVELDGKAVPSASALSRAVALMSPGAEVKLGLYRNGKRQELKLTLGKRPDFEGVGGSRDDAAEPSRSERLGLMLREVEPSLARGQKLPPRGALIAQVVPGSPAERAGLAPGMVVVEVKGEGEIASAAQLKQVLAEAKPGDSLLLRVEIDGARVLRALTIPS